MGRASRNRPLSMYTSEVRVRVKGVKVLGCTISQCKNATRCLIGPSAL